MIAPTLSPKHREHPRPTTQGRPLLEAALDHASRGWPVFPVWWAIEDRCSCGNPDCPKPAKHPIGKLAPHGRNSATIDPEVITTWWGQYPEANIGIPTGTESGLVVVDIDPRNGGTESKHKMERLGNFPITPTTWTGGDGEHIYLQHPGNGHYIKSKSELGGFPGIDQKADGGYIVAPPSNHLSGNQYSWKIGPDTPLAKIPNWLMALLLTDGGEPKRQSNGRVGDQIPQGQRNQTLTSLAGTMRRRGTSLEAIEAALLAENKRCDPSLPENEVLSIARSVSRYPFPGEGWPDPQELQDPKKLSVPTLPEALLPSPLAPWLLDVVERMRLPLEMAAAPAIVSLGALVGASIGIYPKKKDNWIVIPNLWGALVARPGLMKSPVIKEAMRPLQRLATQAQEEFCLLQDDASTKAEILQAHLEGVKQKIRKAMGNGKDEDLSQLEDEFGALKQKLREAIVKERRYIVQDPTVEKLGELLRENPRGLLLLRDELAGWLRTLDKPGREGDREFYLESWNGAQPFTSDRIGRGTVHIPSVTLSIFGGVQPGKLQTYITGAVEEGQGADGLLQRFQVLIWPDSIPDWEDVDRAPDAASLRQAFVVFDCLNKLSPFQLRAEPVEEGSLHAVRFDAAAQEFFNYWRNRLEKRLRSTELDGQAAFEAHLAKYRSLMPSLALLFHLTEVAVGTAGNLGRVGLHHAEMAAAWCDFLEAHAKKVYGVEGPENAALLLADHIWEGKVQDGASCREVYRHGWANLDTPEKVMSASRVLEECLWVRLEERPPGPEGGRPSFRLRLNPKLGVAYG
jgi:Protein of unknown function (DUF3987)/Bifunctional DNA primase/polymerase, N-terminal/Primase C terminal 1 (PriCT-1)